MGAQRGHPRVNEQATVCGLRHDRRGLMDCTSMFAEKNAVRTDLHTAQDGTCNLSDC